MNFLTLTIAGTPQAKARSRKGRYGRWYNPQEKEMIITEREIQAQLPEDWTIIPKGVPVKCSITAFFPFPKSMPKKDRIECSPCLNKKDTDNVAKYFLDSMNKVVYYDDNQIFSLTINKFYSNFEKTEIELEWQTKD